MSKKIDNELNIIINQQSILSQKVGVLMAINTILISFMITLSITYSLYFLIGVIYFLVPILMNAHILYPNFINESNSKYFYDFADMENIEIEEVVSDKNTIEQIKVNSKILKSKYKLYKWSLIITFSFLPLIIYKGLK